MNLAELNKVANAMVAPGRGILAADESTGTIKKRFDAISVECTEDNRRDYREMLFRSAEGMKHISGVILYDETIWQKGKDGTPLVDIIKKAGALPGIKVDEGAKPLPNCPGETITYGLDGLPTRLPKYYEQGARFAKWRAVIDIGAGNPSYACIHDQRARSGALRRALPGAPDRADRGAGSADGRRPRHRALRRGHHLRAEGDLPAALLSARGAGRHGAQAQHGDRRQEERRSQASVQEVAERTVKMLKECVPSAVPGIAFLSGGQSDEQATAHLDAMNKIGGLPWGLTFSYGRALQAAPQKTWSGKADNVPAAQAAFSHRAAMNGLACKGEWHADKEKKAA